jgi:glycosyltransferase involved in cell wall biosynthesis
MKRSMPGSPPKILDKPRILHVLNDLRSSGAEVMMRAAAPYFRSGDVTCEILSTGESGIGSYAEILKDAGYTVHHLPYSRSFRFFSRLRKFVRSGRYDIVHLHAEKASLYTAASVVSLTRVVRTVHNNFTFTGGLGRRRRLTRMLSRMLGVRHLAICPSVQTTERQYLANPTELCMNWYDSEHFHLPTEQERAAARKSLSLADGGFVLISVGNCSPVKNHMAIIDALGQLREYPKIFYLHAGHEADTEEREAAVRLGVAGQVRFLGVVSDVRSLFYAADLLVMPSHFEGLPISLLEGLACGLPALLANSPGLAEFNDWFPGLLYCEPNGSDLARKIEHFADMPAGERRAHAYDWSERAKRTFGVAEGVRRYLAVYKGVLHAKP